MANSHKGDVSLIISGKAFVLRLDANALADAEDMAGVPSILNLESFGFKIVRALFFAAARGQHGLLSLNAAGDLLNEHFTDITKAVTEAYALFFQNQQATETAAIQMEKAA